MYICIICLIYSLREPNNVFKTDITSTDSTIFVSLDSLVPKISTKIQQKMKNAKNVLRRLCAFSPRCSNKILGLFLSDINDHSRTQ